jgi:hypothetical protein
MSRPSRHQSVVSRQSDADYSDDHWLRQFEDKLQKTSVQPRGNSLYDQISSIMNSKSKYPSVQAAVDDMMQRSGLTDYLQTKTSSKDETPAGKSRKTAQSNTDMSKMPKVIQNKPSIMNTLDNIIKDSKGNLSVPAIISRLRSLHAGDISDDGLWEDDKLIRLVSQCNLKAKTNNPSSYDNFNQLGKNDHSTTERDIDPSNTDAFNALMPAKI